MDTLLFRLFDRALRLDFDHPEIGAYLRGAFAPYLHPARPGDGHDAAQISIGKRVPVVRVNGEDIILKEKAFRSPFHTAVYASSAVFQRWFLLHRAYSAWYASGVRIGGAAVLVSAPTGTGKTTLTLELLRRGAGFYGDEFVFVRKADRLVFPFRRSLLIREGTRVLFGDDSRLQQACKLSGAHESGGIRTWHFIHARDIFGTRIEAPAAPLRAAVLLERGERTQLEPISPGLFAVNAALRIGHHVDGLERFGEMLRLLDGVRCFRLVARDVASAAEQITETLCSAA